MLWTQGNFYLNTLWNPKGVSHMKDYNILKHFLKVFAFSMLKYYVCSEFVGFFLLSTEGVQ